MSESPSARIPPVDDTLPGPVRLTIPSVPAALPLARVVATAVAAQADLTIDDISDLTIAVEEAAIALISHGATTLDFRFTQRRALVEVDAGSDGSRDGWPSAEFTNGLGWRILSGLAADVAVPAGDRPRLTFSKRSAATV